MHPEVSLQGPWSVNEPPAFGKKMALIDRKAHVTDTQVTSSWLRPSHTEWKLNREDCKLSIRFTGRSKVDKIRRSSESALVCFLRVETGNVHLGPRYKAKSE